MNFLVGLFFTGVDVGVGVMVGTGVGVDSKKSGVGVARSSSGDASWLFSATAGETFLVTKYVKAITSASTIATT